MMRTSSRLIAAALMAAAIPAALVTDEAPRSAPPRSPERKATQRRYGAEPNPVTHGNRRGPGWSNRHVQRMATKRRNVLRNRKAHRGGKA